MVRTAKRERVVAFAAIAFLFALCPRPSWSSDTAKIIPSRPSAPPIQRLTLDSGDLSVEVHSKNGLSADALLRGSFTRKEWSLLIDYEKVTRFDEKHGFEIEVPLSGQVTRINITAIGPAGQVESEEISILFPRWDELTKRTQPRKAKAYAWLPSLGFTENSYSDPTVSRFTQLSLSAKLTYTHWVFSPDWVFSGTTYVTALPILRSLAVTARFLGINLRMGYRLPGIPGPWQITVFGGVYYTTMFVSPGDFGYSNQLGPQVYPSIRRAFRNGDVFQAYLKFSPVTTGATAFSVSDREIALGGSYAFALSNGAPLSLSMDLASLQIVIDQGKILSNSLSLGVGYGF